MKTKPWTDPVVEEAREAGIRLLERAGGDLHTLCEMIRQSERNSAGQFVDRSTPGSIRPLAPPIAGDAEDSTAP